MKVNQDPSYFFQSLLVSFRRMSESIARNTEQVLEEHIAYGSFNDKVQLSVEFNYKNVITSQLKR